MTRSYLSVVFVSVLLGGCAGDLGSQQASSPDELFGDFESRFDPEDRLLGMTPAEAAEVMNGHWVEDELAEADILVSNDALLLDELSCFESASFDGDSRLVASFSCDPLSQGIALNRILIKDGLEGFHRRIIELDIVGDDIVAETVHQQPRVFHLRCSYPQARALSSAGGCRFEVVTTRTADERSSNAEQLPAVAARRDGHLHSLWRCCLP